MNNNNSNTFRTSNETLFLVNILNTMYNDNLRQITNLTETLNNLNNSNNQIRTLLVQLLNNNHGNGHSRRNQNRRFGVFNNFDYNNLSSNVSGRNVDYLIGEYTFPVNINRQSNNRNSNSTFDEYAHSVFENFFQPIEIYPTQSQIENATRRVRYCDIARPVNTCCPISMDEFGDNDMVTVIRHCGHTFNTENIMNWFRTNCRCPVCRYDIRDYNPNVSNQFFNNSRDSSNNNVERNANEHVVINHTFGPGMGAGMSTNDIESIESLLNTEIFDASGNYVNNTTDILTSILLNALNRSRTTR